MATKKMTNLFTAGKKAALIALLSVGLSPKAHAYDERAYMTPGEHDYYEAYGILPSDIEARRNDKTGDVILFLMLAGGIVYFCASGAKYKKQQDAQQR